MQLGTVAGNDTSQIRGNLVDLESDLRGTTRIQSLGGINTSIGGDISSISGNPAGLGFFNYLDDLPCFVRRLGS